MPVGLKDIIDTKDYPTERGSPVFAGRRPDLDAAVVERLRDAGVGDLQLLAQPPGQALP